VKSHGQQVLSRVFDRKADAIAWEQDQRQRLRIGEWVDPRRGRVSLAQVAADWLASRSAVKRRSRESDEAAWRNYIAPRFGRWPVASITSSEISSWVGGLVARGLAPATVTRALATFRSLLQYAVSDGRVTANAAANARAPSVGRARREGWALTVAELQHLASACIGRYAELVLVLGLAGLRWGELAGLRIGDRVFVPGRGLRVQRAVLASRGGGELYVDSLKTSRARTVPLVPDLVPIIDRWAADRPAGAWLFPAPEGGPLRESNWKRSVKWAKAREAIAIPTLRVHDLRHTAASIWLANGADPKVVQRVLGHSSATMTMDLYGHLVDAGLWLAADKIGDISGTSVEDSRKDADAGGEQ
jgi:integrase